MRGPIQSFRLHVITALVGVVFSLTFLFFLFDGSGWIPKGDSEYHVRALLPTSASLSTQSRVTMAGVRVGRVVGIDRRGTGVVVRMALDKDRGTIPTDTRVRLRLRTLVGEKYIELTPGTARTRLEEDGVLPVSQADDFVDVDQVLSQLRGVTRERARATFQSLGGAVEGKGEKLNRLVETGAGTVEVGQPPVETLAQQHAHITSLVSNLGQIAADIGQRGDTVRSLAQGLDATATAVADRDAALRASLTQLPDTLEQVRATAGTLRSAGAQASPVLTRLAAAVTGLAPTVERLGPAATQGKRLVDDLGPAAPRLQRTLKALQDASSPTVKALTPLKSALCQVNPLVRYVAPYGRELAAVITNLGSAVNAYDANGHIARLYVGVGANSLFGALPPDVAVASNKLLSSGLLAKYHLLGYNPYPAPGKANDVTTGAEATGPQDSKIKYTRVEADC